MISDNVFSEWGYLGTWVCSGPEYLAVPLSTIGFVGAGRGVGPIKHLPAADGGYMSLSQVGTGHHCALRLLFRAVLINELCFTVCL